MSNLAFSSLNRWTWYLEASKDWPPYFSSQRKLASFCSIVVSQKCNLIRCYHQIYFQHGINQSRFDLFTYFVYEVLKKIMNYPFRFAEIENQFILLALWWLCDDYKPFFVILLSRFHFLYCIKMMPQKRLKDSGWVFRP